MVTTEVAADDAARYGIVQVGRRAGHRLRLQARRAGDDDGDQRGLRLHARRHAGPARGAGRRRSGRTASRTSAATCCPPRPATAWPAPTGWRATGATSARSPPTGRRTGTSSPAEPPIDLDDPAWPLHTRGGRHSAARLLPGAVVDESLVSGGTRVAGEVRGSVLSPGVVVEKGATVVDSVLLPGVRVRAGATVTRAVLDDRVEVGERGHRRRRRRHHAGRAGRAAVDAGARGGRRGPAARARGRLTSGGSGRTPSRPGGGRRGCAPAAMAATRRRWSAVATWLTTAISAVPHGPLGGELRRRRRERLRRRRRRPSVARRGRTGCRPGRLPLTRP